MPPIIIAALMAILAAQGQLTIERIDRGVTEIRTVAGAVYAVPGGQRAYGWVECSAAGHVDRLVHNGNSGVLLHEALHGADCVDDGVVNGSLLPYPSLRSDPAHEFIGWAYTHPEQAIEIMRKIERR